MTSPRTPPRPGDVLVWLLDVDLPGWRYEEITETLDAGERQRAMGLLSATERRRFMLSRGLVRLLAARCTGTTPGSLTFVRTPRGKPALTMQRGGALELSWSRSRRLAVLAVARDRPVGVDVEAVRPVSGLLDIARRVLPPAVHAAIAALPPAERPRAFSAWWTRAEACLKARGDGLHAVSELLEAPDAEPSLRLSTTNCSITSRDIPVGRGYAAAVAAPSPTWAVTLNSLAPGDLEI
jgi:4'-phosphopantetheinyl transferase